ncbi:hypothetical protein LTS09_006339 [Friedmanniomyces endolithicus]|nr:hypothetical protein LTS09_006339 [Friedmanniomyces endolithicus]
MPTLSLRLAAYCLTVVDLHVRHSMVPRDPDLIVSIQEQFSPVGRRHHKVEYKAGMEPSHLLHLLLCDLYPAMMRFFSAASCTLTIANTVLAAPSKYGLNRTLRFTNNGTFQLAVFNDLHYGEAENLVWGPQQDVNTTRVTNSVLDNEHPQLVVLNGDLITGENTYKHNSTDYINETVQPLLERDLLWASTYGNHDSDFNLSRHHILKREQTWPNALTRQDVSTPTSGVSNYWLPVYPSLGNTDTPALLLWFFDSRGGNYYEQTSATTGKSVPQPNWVDQTAVDWFTATRTQLCSQYGRDVPSLAFVHIPVNAMLAFQQSNNDTGVRPHYEPGINDDDPLAQQGYTEGQGDVTSGSTPVSTYNGEDVPFMQALLDTPNLIAVFSGHDHGDDWCFKWDSQLPGMSLKGNGLDLCFGRHSGYGGYGSWVRGSRQILVTEEMVKEGVVETRVRLETGATSGSVVLNGTYGSDYYPAVPDVRE